ncbi:hypothetical protein BDK51DRAFT_42678 [Blyttiomyces helicus]|uniref:Ankyrin repeat-containing domain protein n=1 Tax=Blyttiomyces helicus TaxID=388810 RepID=A0A4P9WE39_9FUNG|nr:hypothetical protein BDK51DRAFT_42678 [Blyttiomyces helicus]|eukprot:RKO90025.1 hypothetical protein BDK51DRAFT_42678 [Blyttiomyces helicus]
MDGAISAGRLEIVRSLHDRRGEGCSTQGMDSACENWAFWAARARHLFDWKNRKREFQEAQAQTKRRKELVLFLDRHRSEGFSSAVMVSACDLCCIEFVRFLFARHPEFADANAVNAAFLAGDADIVWTLYEAGTRLSDAGVAALLQ